MDGKLTLLPERNVARALEHKVKGIAKMTWKS
jgi:hypothetical protein